MDLNKTGLFISAMRKQNDWTQKDLADKIGVTDKAVSRWETGKGFPDVSLLPSLADTLGVSISEVVMGEKTEIVEKRALEIMDSAVISTLDYSKQEIRSKSRFRKYVLTTASIVLAIILIFTFFYIHDYNAREFILDGEAYHLLNVSSKKMTLRSTEGKNIVFTQITDVSLGIEYNSKIIKYGGGHAGLSGLGYSFSDGSEAPLDLLKDFTDFQRREVDLINNLRHYYNNVSLKYKYPAYYVLLLVIVISIIICSTYMLLYTEECLERRVARGIFSRGGEPTGFAFIFLKITSIGAIIASFIIFISLIVI